MVETYDTGCTPGGGKDGISVFSDAGLLFQSNMASGTTYRQGDNTSVSSLILLPPPAKSVPPKCQVVI